MNTQPAGTLLPAAAPGRPRRFDAVTITLHWTTLALIVAQFASAWAHALAADGAQANLTLALHRSLGVTVWLVVAGRLAWRRLFAVLPPFPATMPKVQRAIATASEYGLYALLLVQPLTGLAQSLARGRPFALFGATVPAMMARDKALTGLFHEVHEATAWALLALIGLHAAAALFHHMVLRDEVLTSMLPWKPSRRAVG